MSIRFSHDEDSLLREATVLLRTQIAEAVAHNLDDGDDYTRIINAYTALFRLRSFRNMHLEVAEKTRHLNDVYYTYDKSEEDP